MNSELLKPTERPPKKPATEPVVFSGRINEQQITELIADRKKILESIKNQISRKRLFNIEEKITGEENRLKQILDWQEGRQNQLSKYSFVLDTHYFEQEFL